MRIFSFHKIWQTLKIQGKLIVNCPRAPAITCFSHKGQKLLRASLISANGYFVAFKLLIFSSSLPIVGKF